VATLSPEQARERLPVKLTGVVTFTWNAGTSELTVQDDTGAVWISPILLPPNCTVGSQVEVEGHTEEGVWGAIVQAGFIRVIGPGRLPAPRPAAYEDLLSGRMPFERVEVHGVVRRQRVNPEFGLGWLAIELTSGGRRLTVNVTHEITGQPQLVDAQVRVRGVNVNSLDPRQEAFSPMINAHDLTDVEVLEPANTEPFAQPAVPLNRILRGPHPRGWEHRIRVRGTVTAVRPGTAFFLQDETRGIQVFISQDLNPEVGEVVDVVGFAEPGAFSPVLRDAEWRPTGAKSVSTPLRLTPAEALKRDGWLLTVEGELLAIAAAEGETVLTLGDDLGRFRVRVPGSLTKSWRSGSRLAATGVCLAEVGDWESLLTLRRPQNFVLLARGPSDIVQVRAGPWWTPTRIVWVLIGVGAALGVTLGVVWLQARRRLQETARARESAQAQFKAVIGERTRLARELHDTLAQGLAAISTQLEVISDRLASSPQEVRRHLDLARQLTRNYLEEARRAVWDLRAQTLEECGLAGALQRLGRQLVQGSALVFECHTKGDVRTLPADVENNLLRMGQEAISNAVRHAGASHLTLLLEYKPDRVLLRIEDDGLGFELSQAPLISRSGFGLTGLRERAEAMHAQLTINSAPGQGTCIEIVVPHV
jgi:signal transduction histidine kinase